LPTVFSGCREIKEDKVENVIADVADNNEDKVD